jgi:hypothetical protein
MSFVFVPLVAVLARTTAIPAAVEFVVAVATFDDVVVCATEQLVIATQALNGVIASKADIDIFLVGTDEIVVPVVTKLEFFGMLLAAHLSLRSFSQDARNPRCTLVPVWVGFRVDGCFLHH